MSPKTCAPPTDVWMRFGGLARFVREPTPRPAVPAAKSHPSAGSSGQSGHRRCPRPNGRVADHGHARSAVFSNGIPPVTDLPDLPIRPLVSSCVRAQAERRCKRSGLDPDQPLGASSRATVPDPERTLAVTIGIGRLGPGAFSPPSIAWGLHVPHRPPGRNGCDPARICGKQTPCFVAAQSSSGCLRTSITDTRPGNHAPSVPEGARPSPQERPQANVSRTPMRVYEPATRENVVGIAAGSVMSFFTLNVIRTNLDR